MKLIIDIPEEDYNKYMYADSFDEEDGYDAIDFICNGTPLDKIRSEIAEYKDDKIIHDERNEMIDIILEIIDKHISGMAESEEK